MQGKVSMVMTCYNKAEDIGAMFDSIIAQDWNNIELILVNDGSTDGTREIISVYEKKFINRGYTVLIIDQENAGVCAAAKAGLERVTGDYVCCIDADDELMPNYCSVMAGWLEEHKEYDYVSCSPITINRNGEEYETLFNINKNWRGEQLLKWCLINASNLMPWSYMMRMQYFKKCKITENFITNTRGSHEPCIIVPIHAYEGNYKYLKDEFLYRYYSQRDNAHSAMIDVQKVFSHWAEYARIAKLVVLNLPDEVADKNKKERYIKYIDIFEKWIILDRINLIADTTNYLSVAKYDYIKTLKDSGLISLNRIESYDINEKMGIYALHDSLFDKYYKFYKFEKFCKIVVPGAKGKRAKLLIPLLEKFFYIDEYWDISATEGDMTDTGREIVVPEYNVLRYQDIVFILSTNKVVVKEMEELLRDVPAKIIFCGKEFFAINNVLKNVINEEEFNREYPI